MNKPRKQEEKLKIQIPKNASKEEIEEFIRELQNAKTQAPIVGKTKEIIITAEHQDKMRAACAFNADLMDYVRLMMNPGMVLEEIDSRIDYFTREHGHIPACKGYLGYPKSSCISVNNVICHGIPDSYVLKEGDIANVDLTTIVDGWHGDQSETFIIGEVPDYVTKLVQCAFDSMHNAIDSLYPKCKVKRIGAAIEKRTKKDGFSVVKHFQGHGIGQKFHQEPNIPHFVHPHFGDFKLKPGMCFTIEPMINAGKWEAVIDKKDKWTARTLDGSLSAQFEHTILMTKSGPEILTITKHGPQKGHKF